MSRLPELLLECGNELGVHVAMAEEIVGGDAGLKVAPDEGKSGTQRGQEPSSFGASRGLGGAAF